MTELEDLDFTRRAKSEIYDAATARQCFEALGSAHSVPQGRPFFSEGEASEKMYLLLEGEVSLIRGRKMIDIVKAGARRAREERKHGRVPHEVSR